MTIHYKEHFALCPLLFHMHKMSISEFCKIPLQFSLKKSNWTSIMEVRSLSEGERTLWIQHVLEKEKEIFGKTDRRIPRNNAENVLKSFKIGRKSGLNETVRLGACACDGDLISMHNGCFSARRVPTNCIVPEHMKKSDQQECGIFWGISLLSVAGKNCAA